MLLQQQHDADGDDDDDDDGERMFDGLHCWDGNGRE